MCQHDIKEWIWFACQRNDAEELAPITTVEWNCRFTRRLGDGLYNPVTFRARIRLSIPLWPRASEKERRETVIHEACHCIVGYKHGVVAAHGLEWKQAMTNCGLHQNELMMLIVQNCIGLKGDSSCSIVPAKGSSINAGCRPGSSTRLEEGR